MKAIFLLTLTLLAVGGCTWVHLDKSAKNVQIGYAGNIQNCERVGVVTASTQSRVVLERDVEKVQNELYTLAKNNAAPMGATNLIMHAPAKGGMQKFTAYRCADQIASR